MTAQFWTVTAPAAAVRVQINITIVYLTVPVTSAGR